MCTPTTTAAVSLDALLGVVPEAPSGVILTALPVAGDPAELKHEYVCLFEGSRSLGVGYVCENSLLRVIRVMPGSPAAEHGVMVGHCIAKLNGEPTELLSEDDFVDALKAAQKAGPTLALTFVGPSAQRAVPMDEYESRYTVLFDPNATLGVRFSPGEQNLVVDEVMAGSFAQRQGVGCGHALVSIAG